MQFILIYFLINLLKINAYVKTGFMSLLERNALRKFKPIEPETYLFHNNKKAYFDKFKLQGDIDILNEHSYH